MSDKIPSDNGVQFSWGIKRRRGGTNKDVQFYESFTFDYVEYSLFDSVCLFKDDETEPYIGKLIKIWEHKNKIRRVKVLWFFRPHEVSNFLGDKKVLDNELFLACGEGTGLANVNPLEAIAGKCNVVCISKDERNRKPSEYELMNADYIFYRTFNVKKLIISDKLGETIAAVEVRCLLNQVDSQNSSVPKIDAVGSENGPKSFTNNGEKGLVLERTDSGEGKSIKYDDDGFGALIEKRKKPAEGEGAAATISVAVGSDSVKSHCKFGPENILRSISLKLNEVSAGSKPAKDVTKANAKAPEKSKPNTSTRIFDAEENSSVGMTGMIYCTNGVKNAEEHSAGAHNKSQSELKDSKRLNEVAEDLGPSDVKRAKIIDSDDIMKTSTDHGWDILHKSGVLSDCHDTKASIPAAAAWNKTKGKMVVESTAIDTLHKKLKEKISKVSREKLQMATSKPYIDKGSITYGQLVEVTRRPDADRSKWFTGIPWVDRVKNASEKGTLVLLQNLDPTCTSYEVENIIWHGCHESCSAKMIQWTAISSPHSGLAFSIFKTREAAEDTVEKLEKGCLMLPHGRPLVGCIGSVSPPCKQSMFPGHLFIDKIKFQMQKGKKEAVSTSHSSQPNTLEYEMAMEWRLRQARSDFWWKKLHKQQGEELKRLKENMQLKRARLG